jgi:hypothetical protein
MTEPFDSSSSVHRPLRPPSAPNAPAESGPVELGDDVPTEPEPHLEGGRQKRRPSIRVGAVVALALVAGFVAWLVLRNGDSSTTATPSTSTAPAPSAASVEQLAALAVSVGHPVFWLGPKSGYTYELSRTSSGRIFVRYLPPGVDVGSDKPYLTVATYPFAGAFAAVKKEADASGSESANLPEGGIAALDKGYPQSVHVAYPGVDYQVEVFDPTPQTAMGLVSRGELTHLGQLKSIPGTAGPTAATPVTAADLKAVATAVGHPVYWAGAQPGRTYELTRTSTGKVFIRYLPAGVSPGASEPYLTVATYAFPGAFAAVRQSAKGNKSGTIELPDGGLAVVDPKHPTSIRIAYPNSDVQIEVFDPSAAHARELVSSGKIAALG